MKKKIEMAVKDFTCPQCGGHIVRLSPRPNDEIREAAPWTGYATDFFPQCAHCGNREPFGYGWHPAETILSWKWTDKAAIAAFVKTQEWPLSR